MTSCSIQSAKSWSPAGSKGSYRGWGLVRVLFSWAVIVAVLTAATAFQDCCGAESMPRKLGIEGRRLSLFQAVTIAIDRNLRITDARLAIVESEHRRGSAFSDFFPRLDVSYAASADKYKDFAQIATFARSHDSRRFSAYNFIDLGGGFLIPVPGDYPYRIDPYRTFNLTATITQPIYTAGRSLHRYKYSCADVDYASLELEVERQNLILEVYEAYYGLMRGQKLLEVADKSITALEALRNRAKAFFESKVLSKVGLLATEGQLAEARKQRIQAQTEIRQQRERLNNLMRLPLDTKVEIRQDFTFRSAPYKVPEIFSVAAANRVELRQSGISAQQAMALVRIAEAEIMPSIYLALQGSRTNDDWNVLDREAVNDWRITGGLTWSFDTFRKRETLKEKRAGYARALTERERLVQDTLTEVSAAYNRLKRFEKEIDENRKAVKAREECFEISKQRYNALMATYYETLDAERELHQALGRYYESLMDYKLSQAQLERLMGVLLH